MQDIKLETGDTLVYLANFDQEAPWYVKFYRKLITVFTNSYITHIGMVVVIDGVPMIAEATLANDTKIREFKKNEDFFVIKTAIPDKIKEVEEFLNSVSGAHYSIIDAVASIYKLNNPNDNVWFCSELNWYVLTKILGYKLDDNMTPGGVVYNLLHIYKKTLFHYRHKG